MNRRATLADAQKLVQYLSPKFHQAGYNLSLYGSVLLNGEGRDIDLVAVPWRAYASPQQLMWVMRAERLEPCSKLHHGLQGTWAQVFDVEGLLVDLTIREVAPPGEVFIPM